MSDREKRRALILLVLAVVMVVIIAANLRQLEFQPGLPMPELVGDSGGPAPLNGITGDGPHLRRDGLDSVALNVRHRAATP